MLIFRRLALAVLFAFTSIAVAQNEGNALGRDVPLIWEPPTLDFPETAPESTVPKIMIASFHLANMEITLEETTLDSVKTHLGADMGQRGDASEALQWLCFNGTDANGLWALWLESDEMGGGSVDGFALQRLDNDARVDRRCRMLRKGYGAFGLPIPLRLGMTEMQVRHLLGKPTLRYRNTMMFDHDHQETIHNEPFTVSNTVAVGVRRGVVWAIQVWKVTSN
jgi:hypothetical protein